MPKPGTPPTQDAAKADAEAAVRTYCGWHVAPLKSDDVLVLDGPGTGTLVLPSLYVRAISSIIEDGTELVEDEGFSWSKSGVVRRCPAAWVVWNQGRWTNRLRGITVTMDHGYDEWPLEVAAVIDRVLARALEGVSMFSQVGGVQYATGEDGLPVGAAMSSSDRAVLDHYRLPFRP